MRHKFAFIAFALVCVLPATAQWTKPIPITKVTKEADGVRATLESGAVL